MVTFVNCCKCKVTDVLYVHICNMNEIIVKADKTSKCKVIQKLLYQFDLKGGEQSLGSWTRGCL